LLKTTKETRDSDCLDLDIEELLHPEVSMMMDIEELLHPEVSMMMMMMMMSYSLSHQLLLYEGRWNASLSEA